jgi:hypothetical protein
MFKADQERHGAEVAIEAVPGTARCTVTALRRWLNTRGDMAGALFCRLDRGGNLVADAGGRLLPVDPATLARLVKRVRARTGVEAGECSAHSLRAGMMTAAGGLGVPSEQAMEHGRRKSYSAARICRRHSSLWPGNFTGGCSQTDKSEERASWRDCPLCGPSPTSRSASERTLPAIHTSPESGPSLDEHVHPKSGSMLSFSAAQRTSSQSALSSIVAISPRPNGLRNYVPSQARRQRR